MCTLSHLPNYNSLARGQFKKSHHPPGNLLCNVLQATSPALVAADVVLLVQVIAATLGAMREHGDPAARRPGYSNLLEKSRSGTCKTFKTGFGGDGGSGSGVFSIICPASVPFGVQVSH